MCRTSHEVRGLKFLETKTSLFVLCRTSHEVRGLKYNRIHDYRRYRCRTSHEVRGLKWHSIRSVNVQRVSHLTRGAWIEMMKKER